MHFTCSLRILPIFLQPMTATPISSKSDTCQYCAHGASTCFPVIGHCQALLASKVSMMGSLMERTTFVRGLLTRALSIPRIPQVFGFQGAGRSLISGFLTLVMIFNSKVYQTDICSRVASVMSPLLVEENQEAPLEGPFVPFLHR